MAYRAEARTRIPDGFTAPVPSFGDPAGRLLIVGLAPGLHGANTTGRPFTGDWAGDLLYATLAKAGFAEGHYAERADDGLVLVDCLVTNAVRCVPPLNKPTPAEMALCRPFLSATEAGLGRLGAIVALGRVAHESVIRSRGLTLSGFKFGHGAEHALPAPTPVRLFDSYHCSRYNTNTGVLTTPMFETVFARVRAFLDAA